jgi:hypothetical protein
MPVGHHRFREQHARRGQPLTDLVQHGPPSGQRLTQ